VTAGARRVSEETLGAWVIKCDPRANPDVARAARSGDAWVARRWCVADNYRSRMMRAGHRAVLWVSGDGRTLSRGIWGVGWVIGPVPGTGDPDPSPAGNRGRPEVPLHLPLASEVVSPERIRAAGAADLEVLVQPHGSNPSWISRTQLAALGDLLGEWPAAPA
jgi:hypothetical protein